MSLSDSQIDYILDFRSRTKLTIPQLRADCRYHRRMSIYSDTASQRSFHRSEYERLSKLLSVHKRVLGVS